MNEATLKDVVTRGRIASAALDFASLKDGVGFVSLSGLDEFSSAGIELTLHLPDFDEHEGRKMRVGAARERHERMAARLLPADLRAELQAIFQRAALEAAEKIAGYVVRDR